MFVYNNKYSISEHDIYISHDQIFLGTLNYIPKFDSLKYVDISKWFSTLLSLAKFDIFIYMIFYRNFTMEGVQDPYLRHLFDGDPIFNVYNKEAINMSVGAPGPDLLKQCTDMLSNATVHRMVKHNVLLYAV